jgi:hypothetical protein
MRALVAYEKPGEEFGIDQNRYVQRGPADAVGPCLRGTNFSPPTSGTKSGNRSRAECVDFPSARAGSCSSNCLQ